MLHRPQQALASHGRVTGQRTVKDQTNSLANNFLFQYLTPISQEPEVGDTMSIRTVESVMDDFLLEVLQQLCSILMVMTMAMGMWMAMVKIL